MSLIINQPTASWRLSFISNNLVTANCIDLCHNSLRVSYGPIDMKSAPHEICSISISKPTDQTYCTVDVVWAELRNLRKCGTSRQNCEYCFIVNKNLVKMSSWDGNRVCIPNFFPIPFTQFPTRFIQKTAFSPYWGWDCCSSCKWNQLEIFVWMHQLYSITPSKY